jgi:transposase-like protein
VAGMIGGLISVGRGWVDGRRGAVYKGFRFPVEIISHCVYLYHRFPLSFREVEEMMMERGVAVTYETIRAGLVSVRLLRITGRVQRRNIYHHRA